MNDKDAQESDILPEKHDENPSEVSSEELSEGEKLKVELKEAKDKYLRSLAEAENARKRLQKERLEAIQYATEGVLVDFIQPIDNFENALKLSGQVSPEISNWVMGFKMILAQFKEVLSQHGVSVEPCEGMEFDHHRHDAVEIVETSEYAPGTIIKEFCHGYKLGTKTIRPARVKVAKAPSEDHENLTNNTNNEECKHDTKS